MKLLDFGIFRISDSSAFFLWKNNNQLEVSIGKDAYEVGLIWLDQRRLLNVKDQPSANIQACGRLEKTTSCGLKVSCWSWASQCSLWVDMSWMLNCLRTQHRITGAQVRLNDKKNMFFVFVFFEVFRSVMILQECGGYVLQDFLHIKNVLTFPRWLGKTWYKKLPPFHMCVLA